MARPVINIFASISILGTFVAQFKFTVLLMPNGPLRLTGGPFNQEVINSSLSLDDPDLKVRQYKAVVDFAPAAKLLFFVVVKALLASSATRKNKKKKKKV